MSVTVSMNGQVKRVTRKQFLVIFLIIDRVSFLKAPFSKDLQKLARLLLYLLYNKNKKAQQQPNKNNTYRL